MSALSPGQLAVVLALSWAFLLWLHLRKPRLVRQVVAFLQPWEELAPAKGRDRLQSPAARRSWALARALLLATLVALALSDPRAPGLPAAPGTTLLVLDAGAHMRATDEPPTRFARAQLLAAELLDERSRSGEVMVAQLSRTLTPLSSFTRDRPALRSAIERARASVEPTQFAAAVEFAAATLRGRDKPELLLISDGAFEVRPTELERLREAGISLSHLRVGSRGDNLAIRAFAARALAWDAERCEVMVELENTGARDRAAELTLLGDGKPLDVQRLALAAKRRTRQFFTLSARARELTARLSPVGEARDAQPLDDVAYAVLAQPPPRRALLVSDGQPYLERALALDPRLTIEQIAPAAYRSARGYDLVVFDRFVPPSPPEVPSVWLAPPAAARGAAPYRVTGSVERPFFDRIERDHPLLRWVSLRDVNVRRATRVELQPEDLVVAGAREAPLIVTGSRNGQRFIALTFDVRESDLVLRTAWPILLANAIQQLSAAEVRVEIPLQLGRAQPRSVAAEAETASLRTPSGDVRELTAREGRIWVRPDEPGFYLLRTAGIEEPIAANFDFAAGLEIAPRRIAEPPARHDAPGAPPAFAPWWLLLGLALLVYGLDLRASAARGRS